MNTTAATLARKLLERALSVDSRTERILRGELRDVSELAREAGFVWPVALTAAVWQQIEAIPPSQSHQDVTGRLWDVLYMGRQAIRVMRRHDRTELLYRLIMHVGRYTYITLKIVLVVEGGDPTLVIALPYEEVRR
jgi:hypothetical protein